MGINQRADSHQTPKGTIDMTSRNTNSKIRRNTALGVTAGVLGGGAIGLMLGVPGATSAATDDNVAVVSALQDSDGEVTDPSTDDSVEHPVRVELTRQSLQELVDDGTITSEQADAVAEHLIENRPHLGGHRRHGGGRDGKLGTEIADVLGTDVDTLREALRSGQSIADVAEANGVDIQVVIDAMIAQATDRIDTAVENGRLTDEAAAELIDGLSDKIAERVDQTPPVRD